MNIDLKDSYNTATYSNGSQIARIITEKWVKENSYCPCCGNEYLNQFTNNKPVADFYCVNCTAEYELKSQKKVLFNKIVDGAYSTMIQRINSENNPSFFFMNYSLSELRVLNFLVIPKYYFVDEIIEKRKPLSSNARRAGWIGCNILLHNIPSTGKIFLVQDGIVENRYNVLKKWAETSFLANQNKERRGWIIEILKIVEKISCNTFSLKDVYRHEETLKRKFPNNNFIKDKIRQQLQVLRDKGIIEFRGNSNYKKIQND